MAEYLWRRIAFAVRGARDEEGQTLVEYALIIALVALAVTAGLIALAGGINALFDEIVLFLEGLPGVGGGGEEPPPGG